MALLFLEPQNLCWIICSQRDQLQNIENHREMLGDFHPYSIFHWSDPSHMVPTNKKNKVSGKCCLMARTGGKGKEIGWLPSTISFKILSSGHLAIFWPSKKVTFYFLSLLEHTYLFQGIEFKVSFNHLAPSPQSPEIGSPCHEVCMWTLWSGSIITQVLTQLRNYR